MPLKVSPTDAASLAQLGELFEEHRPKLLAMVRRRSDPRLTGRRDPEDILSEAYLKAHAAWPEFQRSPARPYTWLYTIVLNCLYDDHDFHARARRDQRNEVVWPDRSSLQLVLGLVSPLTTASKLAAREEYLALLRERMGRVMEQLKPVDREVLCMRFCDEMSTEEIAVVLGLSTDTVRHRYARARLRFGDLWMKLFGEEGLEP